MVKKVVVCHVNEELGGGGMWVAGAGHSHRVSLVLQTVVGLVFNRLFHVLLIHCQIKAPALNHEAVNDPMKDGAVEVPVVHVA